MATISSPAPPREEIRTALPRRRRSLMGVLAWILLLLIAFLVTYPILRSILQIGSDAAGTGRLDGIDSSLIDVVRNTVIVVGGSSVIALVCGALLAWVNERTDGGFRGLGDFMPVAPLLLPSITGVLGWVVLLDPRVGLINAALRSLLARVGITVSEGPINIFTMQGLVIITALHLIPIIYLVVSASLKNLDPFIEEASRISGAGPFRTALRVTLPSITPSLWAAWLLAVISGIGLFSVPVIIGSTARIDVVSVKIYRYLTSYPPEQGAALILAAAMLVVLLALRLLETRVVKSGRQTTIGGRGIRATPMRLGRFRLVTKGVVLAYVAVAVVLPVLGLLLVSFERFWSVSVPWDRLTLQNYATVINNPITYNAIINSLRLAAVGASVTMFIGGYLMLYASQRGIGGSSRRSAAGFGTRRAIDFITTLPATIPHSLIGVSFILAFSASPFNLYGTIVILLLAHVTMQVPYAASSAGSAVSVLGPELGEASRIFGATQQRTIRRILLPLVLPGLAAGWVLIFIHILGEVTASVMLSGAANPVVGSVLLDLWSQGSFVTMTAFAIIVWLLSSVLVLCLLWLSNRRLTRSTR